MDLYSLFKLLHVITAMAWLGGGLTMLAQAIFAIRDKGEMETLRSLNVIGSMGKRWFIPASLLTVVFGLCMTIYAGLWDQPFVIIGLLGFASTFLTGIFVFEPLGKAIGAAMAKGDEAEALRHGRMLLRISKFDYAIMFVIVADMVLKPTLDDWIILLAGVSIIVVAGAYFLLGFGERRQAVAA